LQEETKEEGINYKLTDVIIAVFLMLPINIYKEEGKYVCKENNVIKV